MHYPQVEDLEISIYNKNTMKEKEKKEMMEVVCEGIDKVIMPVLGKILEKQEAHDKRFDNVDQKLEEHDDRFDNIDRKLDSTVSWVDKHKILMGK